MAHPSTTAKSLVSPPRCYPANPTISARFLRPFRELNAQLGVDPSAEWKRAGGPRLVSGARATVPWDVALRLLRWQVAVTGLCDLGLRAARLAEPELLDVVEYAARSQDTLAGAVDCVGRLLPALSDVSDVSRYDYASMSVVTVSTPPFVIQHPVSVEYTLAYLMLAFRRYTGNGTLAPREVHLSHAAPPDGSLHRELFGAPVRFDMPANRLVFSIGDMGLALVERDVHLSALMERIGERLRLERLGQPTATGRVRDLISRRISHGRGHSNGIARELGIAQRTLHRHLQQEGSTLRQVVDDVRREFAFSYLEDPRLPVSEIAHRLGFAGATGFHRAFKRWTRTTPGLYRHGSGWTAPAPRSPRVHSGSQALA